MLSFLQFLERQRESAQSQTVEVEPVVVDVAKTAEPVASPDSPKSASAAPVVAERPLPTKMARTFKTIWTEQPKRFPRTSSSGEKLTYRDVFASDR